ncbi:enoyl-CoA hydratase/isomerase family protein [Halorarum halophilum]|uniref:Enoyl-CoA hydratase/isomerase family protein n=1 Tax=Halorarum halophilum TaxID=2743090 RepID=A0A7D5GMW1_9EURY|nr:enoyl-CoA hydratase/isomerase family protein [Halobaculum halophilum]QLG29067.1 enoyl-CoA hydratase/isomerase family protein [Halobaculum halophilum]
MLSYDLSGDAAWITIDRPEKRNALPVAGWRELTGLLRRAEGEARVAVVTGVGDAFCAGDDIAALDAAETDADVAELADSLYDALFGVEKLDVPVVAAVNGLAYGGGCELVAASDLAVAVEDAAFALPETTIGAYPPYAMERVASTVGKKRLMELALTGEPIDAEWARDWGLVNRVVGEGDLSTAVEAFVSSIAESPPTATRTAKRAAAASLASADERERVHESLSTVLADEECRAAARSFLED